MIAVVRVLLVEDNPADARLLQELLKDCDGDFQVTHAVRLEEALGLLNVEPMSMRMGLADIDSQPPAAAPYDVVLLDLTLPDSGGIETVQRMSAAAPQLPVVVMTGLGVDEVALAAVGAGAQDYLVKGSFEPPLLQRAIVYAIERKQVERTLYRQSFYDPITGLPNRTLLIDRIDRALLRRREYDSTFGVLSIKLQNYSRIAGSYGQELSEEWLKSVASRLSQLLKAEDTLARLGPGWLAVLVEDLDHARLMRVAERIQSTAQDPVEVNGHSLLSAAAIGISSSDIEHDKASDYLRDARVAMHRARELGGGTHKVFHEPMHKRVVQRLNLENELRAALLNDEIKVYYQPIVWFHSGEVAGFEALVRWQHPTRGLLTPGAFLEVAEAAGLMPAVLECVFPKAVAQLSRWQQQSTATPPLTMSVNLSASQLLCGNALGCIDWALREHPVFPFSLAIEITEQVIVQDDGLVIDMVKKLRALKMRVLLDDFGVGYSSLSCLHRFSLDGIKIDRSFVSRVTGSDGGADIVRAIVTLAQSLNMSTIAEGIETSEQLRVVQALGCDIGQGFLFSKAVDEEAAGEAIEEGFSSCVAPMSSTPALAVKDHRGHVLLIDDDRPTRRLVQMTLEENGFMVDEASNATEGLELAAQLQPEVILMDLQMPGMNGLEACRRLQQTAETSSIPVLFFTGHGGDEPVIVEALKVGANDFLSKDASPAILCARLATQITISRTQAKLRRAAVTDELTGVFSRRFLLDTLRRTLKSASRLGGVGMACVLVDIDHFKEINDTLGHLEGDRVLVRVAKNIDQCTRDTDMVARFGGEEFVVVLPNTGRDGALLVAEKICERVAEQTQTTVSVGAAYLSTVPLEMVKTREQLNNLIERLLRAADGAMYRAKREGRNRAVIHEQSVAHSDDESVAPAAGQTAEQPTRH